MKLSGIFFPIITILSFVLPLSRLLYGTIDDRLIDLRPGLVNRQLTLISEQRRLLVLIFQHQSAKEQLQLDNTTTVTAVTALPAVRAAIRPIDSSLASIGQPSIDPEFCCLSSASWA